MTTGTKMKNRGLGKYLYLNLREWDLPREFTADNVLPYVKATFPHAHSTAVSNALHQSGAVTVIGRGLYSKKNGIIGENATEGLLDEALEALVKVETVLVSLKPMLSKFNEFKKMFNE